MNRTTLSLIAGATALAAVTGFASLSAPDASGTDAAGAAARLPVERTSLLCPAPSTSDLAETTYTSFTPVTKGAEAKGAAALRSARADASDDEGAEAGAEDDASDENGESTGDAKDETDEKDGKDGKDGGKGAAQEVKPPVEPEAPGKPATGTASGGETPAFIGTADGSHASGWTVQQTTEVTAGNGRGMLGVACTPADTEFWFPGASTASGRTDYVHLTNPDDSAAVVDIELYGKDGALESTVGEGITVAPNSSEPILLSTLSEAREADLTVHIGVRSGRVGAAVQSLDETTGGDWLAAAGDPAGSLVLPGIPEDATAVHLVVFTPGGIDADLKVRLASPSGMITPAGHETLHVKAGMTMGVDLGDVMRGEAGSLVLTPTGSSVPVVAAARVVRGKGEGQESAFVPATRPVGKRATAADNRAKVTRLSLAAPTEGAKVKVTASAGSDAGAAASRTYTLKAGTTQNVELPVPEGLEGSYALTVEPLSGGPVYAARTLLGPEKGDVAAFTVQTLPDDRGMVAVPHAEQDLSVLVR
ncbi:DUF5719 family protein [Streptomyces tagetis]|uniref:Secreted protein n=1 Tax=Streptomyces tagetis TaxID=2820809 RepID=A0A941B2M8_9ACTN|nr:DUF5719 family protein [Streptomyces sp. RG38]MBQ0829585.1 hypothetical protein [Streptomyces sp. RG38]